LSWEDIKKETIKIGKFRGYKIHYDYMKKEFLACVKDEILRAKSQQILEKQINVLLEVKLDKVIHVERYRIAPPELIQVVQRGDKCFGVYDGKLKPISSMDLYEYSEEAYNELKSLAEQNKKIEEQWRQRIDSMRSLWRT